MLDRKFVLLLAVVLLGVFVLSRTVQLSINENIKMTVVESNVPIGTITDVRNEKSRKGFYIDIVDFENTSELVHSRLGALGYKQNFFIDFSTKVEVKQSGRYFFEVVSDDGFILSINEKEVCRFDRDRGFELTTGEKHLDEGEVSLFLTYFQGGGPLGLRAWYRHESSSRRYFIGESSRFLSFSTH